MGWAVGYDDNWERDIGYGVPAYCDHPDCKEEIDRGLAFVCGGQPYGGEEGCGLYFCEVHLRGHLCERCEAGEPPFEPKSDHPVWEQHKLTDPSWKKWREENGISEGCMCQGCGKIYRVDLDISDELWNRIRPEGKPESAGLLCGCCIMERIEKLGKYAAFTLLEQD